MTVTIETSGLHEIEQLLQVLKSLNIKIIQVQPSPIDPRPTITKGDKKLESPLATSVPSLSRLIKRSL